MRAIPIAVLLTLLINATAAQAYDELRARSTLKGLPGVSVVVDDFSDLVKGAGFDIGTFQTDVELKLRLAGIKVLTDAERLETEGNPRLVLVVHLAREEPDDWYVFRIAVELGQLVRLERNGFLVPIVTWEKGFIGGGPLSAVRDAAKDRVDEFINAWLSVNPK